MNTTNENKLLLDEYYRLEQKLLHERIELAKEKLGKSLVILGHHYQRDEIIQHADYIGDSYKLAKIASENKDAKYIVFCGVHFMAESASILAREGQVVILPDLEAGCTLADMAKIEQVEECWDYLSTVFEDKVIPITYINSSAEIKAFCGKNGGTICTSSNAEAIFRWAFKEGQRILFFPDEHLGRNIAYFKLNLPLESMFVWDPNKYPDNIDKKQLEDKNIILWKGFCCVHMQFNKEQIYNMRNNYPNIKIIVHPECKFEVVELTDYFGSTEFIIKKVSESAEGSQWAVGTEINLVRRLSKNNPQKFVRSLSNYQRLCATMFRINPQLLLWVLENILVGNIVNQITVKAEIKENSLIALNKMLSIF